MKSCLYKGVVNHKRFVDKGYHFSYGLFMFYIDLNEVPFLFKDFKLCSYEKRNVVSFRRSDYHGDPNKDLKEEVCSTVFKLTGVKIDGPVRMLTHLRILGVCFNPVTFYYCFDSSENLQVILAEIENTPWGERYCYASRLKGETFNKEFHVSPFFDMNIQYDWNFSQPEEDLNISMNSFKEGEVVFNANLKTKKLSLSPSHLNSMLLKYPWMTLKVILGIYIQAAKIWFRGTTFYSHPNTNSQKNLLFFKGDKK